MLRMLFELLKSSTEREMLREFKWDDKVRKVDKAVEQQHIGLPHSRHFDLS